MRLIHTDDWRSAAGVSIHCMGIAGADASSPAAGRLSSATYNQLGTYPPFSWRQHLYDRVDVRNKCARSKPINDSKEMTMRTDVIDALHDIHTATNDVLEGYREMVARAEPEIQNVIRRLTEMHQRHASEQEAELARLRDATKDDSSLQGTVNKVVVILRDWLSNMDREVLPAVRKGEESLLDVYKNALEDLQVLDYPPVVTLLKSQHDSIASEIARLPKG